MKLDKYFEKQTVMLSSMGDDYAHAFRAAQVYAVTTYIRPACADEMLTDLADMLITAERNNKPVSDITGDDLKTFCRDYFSARGRVGHTEHGVSYCSVRVRVLVCVFDRRAERKT